MFAFALALGAFTLPACTDDGVDEVGMDETGDGDGDGDAPGDGDGDPAGDGDGDPAGDGDGDDPGDGDGEDPGDGDGEEPGDGDGDEPGDGDGDEPGDGDGDEPVEISHAIDIQPIWDASCVTACHQPGGSAGALLDLSGDAYDAIVGVASGQSPLNLVEPGSSADSYIVAKLRGTQAQVGGVGQKMPLGPPLAESVIVLVEDWIDAGAQP